MRDRVPTPGKENRVKITQDDGTVIEGVLSYADDATQDGSAYTKGNVLPDEVCDLMALDHDESEPDDAFRYLALMQASVYGKIVVTITSNGLPMVGINFTIGSHSVTTNSQGQASVIVSPGNYTATFSNTLDLIFSPASMQVTATKGKINYYSVTASEASTTQQTFTSSTSISFSSRVSDFDVFCVGGGGSGAAVCGMRASNSRFCEVGASGGGGGYTATARNITNTGAVIRIVIGSGGSAVSAVLNDTDVGGGKGDDQDGNPGGETYVSMGSKICSALGGNGGKSSVSFKNGFCYAPGADGGSGSGSASGYPVGSSGYNGGSGGAAGDVPGGTGQGTTTRAFGESSGTQYSPAGRSAYVNTSGQRSEGTGGTGAGEPEALYGSSESLSAAATQGSVAGAGGGACAISNSLTSSEAHFTSRSGAGRAGLVIIRWRYN